MEYLSAPVELILSLQVDLNEIEKNPQEIRTGRRRTFYATLLGGFFQRLESETYNIAFPFHTTILYRFLHASHSQ